MTNLQNLTFMIARAQADYARCIDDDRLEEWPSFFVEDCLYKVTTADIRSTRAKGRCWIEQHVAAVVQTIP